MFIWASLARHAKFTRLSRVVILFFALQCLLAIPIGIVFIRTPPSELYPRLHGGPDFDILEMIFEPSLIINADENGFISYLTIPNLLEITAPDRLHRFIAAPNGFEYESGFLLAVTPYYIYYIDANAYLAVPVNLVPAWVLEQPDFRELFNHLALYNRYFSAIVAPVFLLVYVVVCVSNIIIFAAAVFLFGQWRKLTATLNAKEGFAVCTFAAVPAALAAFAFGLILPVAHIVVFQLLMIYFAYKALKEFT